MSVTVTKKASASTKEGEWELRDGKFYRRDTVSVAPAETTIKTCAQCPIHVERIKSLEKTIIELRAQISKLQIEIKSFASIKIKYEQTIAELRKKLAGYNGWVSASVHKTMIAKYEARIRALEGRKPEEKIVEKVVEKVVEKEVVKIETVPGPSKIQTQIIERTVLEKQGVALPPQVAWSYPVVEEVRNVVVQAPPVQMVQYAPTLIPVVAPVLLAPVPVPAPVPVAAPVRVLPAPAPVQVLPAPAPVQVQQVRTAHVVPQATFVQPVAQPTYSVSERSWIVDGPVDQDHFVQTTINPGPSAGGVGAHGVARLETKDGYRLPAGAKEIPNYASLGGVVPGTHAPYTKIQVPNNTVLGGTLPVSSAVASSPHTQITTYGGPGLMSASRPIYNSVGSSPRITDTMVRIA